MIRVAAVADIHLGVEDEGALAPRLQGIEERADVLLLGGDLTHFGTLDEIDVVVGELGGVPIPIIAVLGNHDFHSDCEAELAKRLEAGGVTVLDGTGTEVELDGGRLGVAGIKGFGGGFPPAPASVFGEPEMKAFACHGMEHARRLEEALSGLETPQKVALTHYAPVADTLEGERPEIYPFLGSIGLAEAIDRGGADLAIHGHAHYGSERGTTPGGVEVRNVAQPLIKRAYAIFQLDA